MFNEKGNLVGRAVHPIEGMTFKEFFTVRIHWPHPPIDWSI
jgi:hypothetical protein